MQKTVEQETLTPWEVQQAQNARHRALIMQILRNQPEGLTTQQIVVKEIEYYGYTFLTDNRLRELKVKGWVRKSEDKPALWIALLDEEVL
jgi:hypothetical protein